MGGFSLVWLRALARRIFAFASSLETLRFPLFDLRTPDDDGNSYQAALTAKR
jgi:hypothetical protein